VADQFDGTAEQLLAQLMERVGAKARVSLERIKAACDRIEAMRGLMNYSRVAATATDLFGGPRAQTIQNNRHLKAYIATRISEYQGTRSKGTYPKPREQVTNQTTKYPAIDLDAKTRMHIDILRESNEMLARENLRLTQLLEQESLRRPLSLTEAFGRIPTGELALDIRQTIERSDFPPCLLDALEVVFNKQPVKIQIQRRGHSTRLSCEVDGIAQTLLTPAQWVEVDQWVHTEKHEK
jgi:hypothetical protein